MQKSTGSVKTEQPFAVLLIPTNPSITSCAQHRPLPATNHRNRWLLLKGSGNTRICVPVDAQIRWRRKRHPAWSAHKPPSQTDNSWISRQMRTEPSPAKGKRSCWPEILQIPAGMNMLVTLHIDVEYIQDIQGPAITERPTLFNSPALNLPRDRRVTHFKLLFFFFSYWGLLQMATIQSLKPLIVNMLQYMTALSVMSQLWTK